MKPHSKAGGKAGQAGRRKAVTPRASIPPRAAASRRSAKTVQETEIARLTREHDEALERKTATSEILQLVSKTPADLDSVFQAILERATRICEAKFGTLFRFDGTMYRVAARLGTPPELAEFQRRRGPFRPQSGSHFDQLTQTKQMRHAADEAAQPVPGFAAKLGGARSTIYMPMLKNDVLIGAIVIYRQEVRPFTDKQIALLENFAAQAVIAIENTRLLNELRQSLDQQTAMADVLRVISSSPSDLEPVFQALLENATRICEAKFGVLFRFDGEAFHFAAGVGTPPEYDRFLRRRGPFQAPLGSRLDHVMRTKRLSHTADDAVEAFPTSATRLAGARTIVDVPMLKDDALIGFIAIYRQEVRPFTDKQIVLLQNFAAQAVIAIENTRLLGELRQRTADLTESLERQTATAEVLRVISSSPGALEPVFQAILENATRICGAKFGGLALKEGDAFRFVAFHNAPPAYIKLRQGEPWLRSYPNSALERALATKRPAQIADITENPANLEDPIRRSFAALTGARTIIFVPMLKDNDVVGLIIIYRQEVRSFTDKQIEVLTNFAAQAVIAIENTRLLSELRQRTDDLSEALEQQTATSAVLGVISSSPGELGPVFDSMLANATRICQAKFGILNLYENGAYRFAAGHNVPSPFAQYRQREPVIRFESNHALGRVATTRQLIHIVDYLEEPAYKARDPQAIALVELTGVRTFLVVPMLKENEFVGAISIYRQEVLPFTDKQIALVQNFAAQAVIAIENTRLLNELRESLDRQTATADVLRVVSSSPGEGKYPPAKPGALDMGPLKAAAGIANAIPILLAT
jgi:GAF domain-containing protein